MEKNEELDKFKDDAEKIASLGLKSRSAMVAKLVPQIEGLQNTGYPLTRILEILNVSGFQIASLASFKTTLYRLQEKEKANLEKKTAKKRGS